MKNYFIAAYDRALTEHELETIASMCGGIKIEWVCDNDETNLLSSIEVAFNRRIRACYRLLAESIPATMILAAECPIYVGEINEQIERYCVQVMTLYMHSQNLLSSVYGIKEEGETRFYEFKEYFGKPSHILTPTIELFEDEILADMNFMENALKKTFDNHRFQ